MCERKDYPIGIQDFEKLISENFLYVDKTEFVYRLTRKSGYYFLSRPRRFGKSLLISTLEAFFLGKRELFKGLAIDCHEGIEWREYPVFHIDFNIQNYSDGDESLGEVLDMCLREWEEHYDIESSGMESYSIRFKYVIEAAYRKTGLQAVVLVDEYDRPLLQNLKNPERQEKFRNILKGFFGVLKSCDRYIKFGFLTGVTKFGRVSVFSDLNNLSDITLLRDYNAICGITETELAENFREGITELGEQYGLGYDETRARLKKSYDGYRFTGWKVEGIYNPFSLLSAFNNREFSDYWFLSATPTMLIELLKKSDLNLFQLDGATRTDAELMGLEPMFRDPVPLLFQSGYLTIKEMEPDGIKKIYTLGFPNQEVERGFLDSLLPYYVNMDQTNGVFRISRFVKALRECRIEDFMNLLTSLIAGIPYGEDEKKVHENRFRDVMFILCRLIGLEVECEIHTVKGRIDMTVKTDRFIYVMEFKVDETPDKALEQIDRMHYADPYIADGRTVVKLGVQFSTEERNIHDWKPVMV
jgi:hypothetical protein